MKKLLGLVAVALMLSFATVSVAWAGPAQNHDQHKRQGKEEQRKTAKQPTGVKQHKDTGKKNVKAPPAHNRSQIKQNRQDRPPTKISGHTPADHSRSKVNHYNRQPQGPDRVGPQKPADNNHRIKHDNRHPAKNHDKWFRGDNIIAFFLGDDGYSQAFIWRRDEVETHSLALGILTPDLQIVYSSYDADMPPDLAAGYTQEVLWAMVDDES